MIVLMMMTYSVIHGAFGHITSVMVVKVAVMLK